MCRTNAAVVCASAVKLHPDFFNTMEDAGALPIEVDVSNLNMGDVIDVYPYKGEVRNHETGTAGDLRTETRRAD